MIGLSERKLDRCEPRVSYGEKRSIDVGAAASVHQHAAVSALGLVEPRPRALGVVLEN